MFEIFRKEIDWGGKTLVLETGKVARQADGSIMASMGETTVLCTAVAARKAKPGQDFFPLTVNYQEKTYAVGKIPGGFFKREGRPTEKETLTSRLIDRPIRPLFPKGFMNEVQVTCQVVSANKDVDPDIPAMIGTSAARACLIASIVCGMMLSSAATTRITISVTWAPRARIAVNASWPGVSRNVIFLSPFSRT